MYTTPFVPHVFSSFLFYQELRIFKNYRAFRFKFPDKKLISLRRFTIYTAECRWFIKICCFSFFRIRSAIAQQISSHFRRFKTILRVWIGVELNVQLHLHFRPCVVSMQESTSRDQIFSSHTLQPPANDIYVKCTFWWHFLFSTTVPWLYSKDGFRVAMVHLLAEKIRPDGCWSNMFPCVSVIVVVDYDKFG